jgi:hypothetical protein
LVTQGDGPGALQAYRKALAIHERLADRDPQNTEWQRDLSVSQFKLGKVARIALNASQAKVHFESGRAILLRLVAIDPGNAIWQADLAFVNRQLDSV